MLSLLKDLRSALQAAAVLAVLFGGCGQREQIARYTVQKPEVVDPRPVSAAKSEATSDQETLGAIIVAGDLGWFFKLSGDPAAVEPQSEAFLALIKSVQFSSGADPKPSWTLPEAWKELPGSGMRFATIQIAAAGKPLELTVIPLPKVAVDDQKFVLDNINRWRGQVNLKPVTAEELSQTTESFKVGAYDCTFVRLIGTGSGGMTGGAPFAPFAAGGGATPRVAAGKKPGSDKIAYDAPPEWAPGAVSQFSIASFTVSEGDRQAQITISTAGGDVAANINRWRGQLGLSPASSGEIEKGLTKIDTLGVRGDYVELTGDRESILGVIATAGGQTWFVKLKGDRELAAREKPRFEAFVKSLRLP